LAPCRNSEGGWALVSVLLTVTAISMLAAAAQSLVLTGLRAEQRAWERAKLETLLDAGMNAAVFALITHSQDGWRIDGTPRDFTFDGKTVHIAVQDERGRIDINSADGSLLRELFLSAQMNEDDAEMIVASILDWRSASGLGIAEGATEHERRSPRYRPRHGAFQSVDELRLVPDMTQDLYERVAPALTVYSKLPTVDQTIAPREVLGALNRAAHGVDDLLRARSSGTEQGSQSQSTGATLQPAIPIVGRTFSISVTANGEDRTTRTAVVLLTNDQTNPYLLLDWR
jgi:general secretion pathway protein K